MRRRITSCIAQELTLLDDEDASELTEIICEKRLSMREVRRIVKHHRQQEEDVVDLLPLPVFGYVM